MCEYPIYNIHMYFFSSKKIEPFGEEIFYDSVKFCKEICKDCSCMSARFSKGNGCQTTKFRN